MGRTGLEGGGLASSTPSILRDSFLFSGMRASCDLLRRRGRTLLYHSQDRRMISPSASYGDGISE